MKYIIAVALITISCQSHAPLWEGAFNQDDSPEWFTEPPVDDNVVYAVRTAIGRTPQHAIMKATTLAQCGLHIHNEEDAMWVERQKIVREGTLQFRAYILGATEKKE